MAEGDEQPRRLATHGALSARRDPEWLNQATVKGTILVLAGAAITTITSDSTRHVAEILGALLVAWALSEVWFRLVRKAAPRDLASLLFPLTLLLGGGALLLDVGPAISVLVGIALVARGVVLLVARAAGSAAVPAALARSIVMIIAGGLMIAVPDAFLLGLRAFAGGGAVVLGGILLAAGLGHKDEHALRELDLRGAGRLAEDWVRGQRLGTGQVEDISETLFFEAPNRAAKLASFWVMMCLATAIAAFAVIQDSTAVVIGAMLVAPLMTPIMGIAAGMVNGWAGRMASSVALVAPAVAAAIHLSWIIAAWLPSVGDLSTNAQITSRTSPNILDLCIAVAAGSAGAYAIVDPRVSSSLSGVAIAVALVPPLAVVGITLEAGMGDDALGAFLLFLTNFVSIVLAGSVVLILTGYARLPRTAADREQQWRILGPVLVGAVLILIPLSLTSFDVWNNASNTATAETVVDEWLGRDRDLSQVRLEADGDQVDLVLTGSGEVPPISDLQQSLDEAIGQTTDLQVRLVPSELLSSPPG